MIIRQRKFRALTLIELLVAGTVCSALVGLLVPALSQSKSVGIRQAELNNLRTLINTAHIYANRDPENILGPIHRFANSFHNEGYADYGGGPGTMNFVNWDEAFDPRTRPFNQLMFGRDGLNEETAPGDRSVFKGFQCLGEDLGWQQVPGFDSDARETENDYFEANGTSFRLNNLKVFSSRRGFFGIYARPRSRIPAPGQTIAFMEARTYETVWTNDTFGILGQDVEGGLELKSYHKKLGHFLVVYVDGHAAFADFGNGTYFPHLPYFNNSDFRGTWGRMDALPDAGIRDNPFRRSTLPEDDMATPTGFTLER